MKLEPGKFYKTRDSRKARVYAVDAGGGYPAHGAILKDDKWELESWTLSGVATLYRDTVTDYDLISEWTEPRTGEVWVNVYDSDAYGFYITKEESDRSADQLKCNRIARIRVKWTEGQYDT